MAEDLYEHVNQLAADFATLVTGSRGDSARGKNFYTLHLLDFIWSQPQFPLYTYRPTRNPAAFLAMVFDLIGDYLHGYADRLQDESGRTKHTPSLQTTIRRRLGTRWDCFIDELVIAGLSHLAAVLDETTKTVLRSRSRSSLPSYLHRLRVYMTPSQLAQVKVNALIDHLTVMEVFSYLGFRKLSASGQEQHPVGGDLRKSIRETFDEGWQRALEKQSERNLVTLFASQPVDILRLTAMAATSNELTDCDFAVFYAVITDAKAPGRTWQPPEAYVGSGEEDQQTFAYLTARTPQDVLSRKLQGLARLGLSSTFPKAIRVLDTWLAQAEDFPDLHARRPWRQTILAAKDEIAQARARFLHTLTTELADHRE